MIQFAKYEGAGNDFILLEDFEEDFQIAQVPFLCDRHRGIGADGLILARHSQVADFQMVFFNKDGSKGAMCGNGLRCLVHFLIDQGKKLPSYQIEIEKQVLTVNVEGEKISTFLGPAKVLKWDEEGYVVDTGAIHAVIFAKEEVDVVTQGERLRHDARLHPSGVNVNFVWHVGKDALRIRTYEKGVEGETKACGTGAAASCFVAHRLGLIGQCVKVYTHGGDELEVDLSQKIKVSGPSKKVFEGTTCMHLLSTI